MRCRALALPVMIAAMMLPHLAAAQVVGDQPTARVAQAPGLPSVSPAPGRPTVFRYELPGRQSLQALAATLPRTLPLYDLTPALDLVETIAGDIMRANGIEGAWRQDPDSPELRLLESGPWHLEIDERSGALFVGDMSRLGTWKPTPGERLTLLSEADFIQDALEKLGHFTVTDHWNELAGVPGSQIPVSLQDRQGLQISVEYEQAEMVVADADARLTGKTTRVRGPARVIIRPLVNGVPTVGPGGNLTVFYDEGNEIAGVKLVQRRLQEARGSSRLVPLMNVAESLEAAAPTGGDFMRARRNVIRSIRLGYYRAAADQVQTVAQPVYVFEGATFARDGEQFWSAPFMQLLPAGHSHRRQLLPGGEPFQVQPHMQLQSPWDERD